MTFVTTKLAVPVESVVHGKKKGWVKTHFPCSENRNVFRPLFYQMHTALKPAIRASAAQRISNLLHACMQ